MKQFDLFAPETPTEEAPGPVAYTADPVKVRIKLLDVLGQLQGADRLPWDEATLLYHRTVFPQMSRWLPDDEAAELRGCFEEAIRRLCAA